MARGASRETKFARVTLWHKLVPALILLTAIRVQSAVIPAASMSRSDVGAAVALTQDGDTVIIPAGTVQWTNTLNITNAITLEFSGIGQSIIQDYIIAPRGMSDEGVIDFVTTSNKAYRLTGLEIDRGLVRTTNLFDNGAIEIFGYTTAFRVDNCAFNGIYNTGIYPWDAACGVIDHCVFNLSGDPHGIFIYHDKWANGTFGDGAWDTPVAWGSSNAVYVESCAFTNNSVYPWSVLDCFAGAHFVFRYNTVVNGFVTDHGTESGGLYRGPRSFEVYGNTFLMSNDYPNALSFRGGTGVIWSNTAKGYTEFGSLSAYRCSDIYQNWGAAQGTNTLDMCATNGPFLTVTHTGTNKSPMLVVSGANWSINQWKGYSVIDISEPGASTNFAMIRSNNATTACFITPETRGNTVFNNGDTVVFYQVLGARDMPGMSTGPPVTRNSTTFVPILPWPAQQIEPIYCWNNTLDGVPANLVANYPVIVQGIHWTNGVVKPGYIPLIFPHPLISGVTIPLPPSNLRVAGSP
jgi:hypothetical protein